VGGSEPAQRGLDARTIYRSVCRHNGLGVTRVCQVRKFAQGGSWKGSKSSKSSKSSKRNSWSAPA
jgi:hypothetical protein